MCEGRRGIQAQLNLKEGQGIVVEAVVEDSPGAKAGIKQYDVLVRAGDRELTKVQDLIDEVDKVKAGKLSIELVRQGEKMTVEVTPEKRPPSAPPSGEAVDDSADEWRGFFDYMQQWEPGKDGRPSMKFRFWRQPGTFLPGGPKPEERLPGNVTVHIEKKGDQPASIEVTRDGKSWNVTENELDKLPGDLRPHVERMLGKSRPGNLVEGSGRRIPCARSPGRLGKHDRKAVRGDEPADRQTSQPVGGPRGGPRKTF